MSAYNFFVSGPEFTKFFRPLGDEMYKYLMMIKYFSDFRYADTFRRHLRLKSTVVKNRARFWTFFALRNFVGEPFQKLYPRYHACLAARRLIKFRGVIPTSPRFIGIHTLNYKPTLKCSPLIFRAPLGCTLVNLGESLVRVKI